MLQLLIVDCRIEVYTKWAIANLTMLHHQVNELNSFCVCVCVVFFRSWSPSLLRCGLGVLVIRFMDR